MGETDKNSLVGQIGQILGVLKPIPEQMATLFDKVEVEGRERLEEDGKIKSDLRSAREALDRLETAEKDTEALNKEQESQIRELRAQVAVLTASKKSAKALAISIGGHIVSVSVALLIAYLAYRFGWAT